MAIAHVGDGGYGSAGPPTSGTTTLNLSFPAGIATGNLVIAIVSDVYLTSGSTIATPTGWTAIGNAGESTFTPGFFTKLYLFGAIYSGGLTGSFVASNQGANWGLDGEIKGFSGTATTIAAAIGNFTSFSPGSNQTTSVIPGPSGFTSGQWNLWASIDYNNSAQPSTSPTLSNIYYNAGSLEAFIIGTTAPGSAPGSETITWATSGTYQGVGVTILPPVLQTYPDTPWWPNQSIRRPRQVDRYQSWDLQPVALRNLGIPVPTAVLPPPFWDNAPKWKLWNRPVFDQPEFWRNRGILVPTQMPPEPFWDSVKPYETAKQHLSRLGFEPLSLPLSSIPASVLPTAWFDPPVRWKAPPGFEIPPPKPFGITVPTQLPPESFWEPVKDRRGNRQTLWNTDVLQPITAAVIISPPDNSWTLNRQYNRPAIVWDSQTPQPFGTTVPTSKPSEPWFDPPKRWKAPPGFEEPPWRNLGIQVPTTKPSEPWFDPPQRWAPKQWFEVTWFQNYGIQVPTTKPSEPWFDPPIRWKAGPGFEPQPLRSIISFTATPSSALPIPWFDPPKRWLAPPGFEPTWTRPFGTQVPTSVLPPEWWTAIRAKPPVSTWSLDVPGPFVAVQAPSFIGAEWWFQARRQAAALTWDGTSPLSPLASPPFIGGDWWVSSRRAPAIISWDGTVPSSALRPILIGSEWWTGAPNARRRAEWWDFLPPGSRLAPYMDQAWWGLTRVSGRADDWRFYPSITPSVGGLEGWQAAFFVPTGLTRRQTADWSLGPFFAFVGTPTFVAPLQIVNAPVQTFVVEGDPVSDIVYAVDIRNFK